MTCDRGLYGEYSAGEVRKMGQEMCWGGEGGVLLKRYPEIVETWKYVWDEKESVN